MNKFLIPALLAALVAACSSAPPVDSGAPVEQRAPVKPQGPVVTTVTTEPVNATGLPTELTDPKSVLSKRSVYFDLDKYEIKPEHKDLVAAHAKFLVAQPQFKVLLQGNTDERGSSEYNLSLGQKRADVVKKSLQLLGVRENQIESVSLGKEKPKDAGHDEAAWAENRRADFLYKGPTGSGEF